MEIIYQWSLKWDKEWANNKTNKEAFSILKLEVKHAINNSKSGNIPGLDNVYVKIIKFIDYEKSNIKLMYLHSKQT